MSRTRYNKLFRDSHPVNPPAITCSSDHYRPHTCKLTSSSLWSQGCMSGILKVMRSRVWQNLPWGCEDKLHCIMFQTITINLFWSRRALPWYIRHHSAATHSCQHGNFIFWEVMITFCWLSPKLFEAFSKTALSMVSPWPFLFVIHKCD